MSTILKNDSKRVEIENVDRPLKIERFKKLKIRPMSTILKRIEIFYQSIENRSKKSKKAKILKKSTIWKS